MQWGYPEGACKPLGIYLAECAPGCFGGSTCVNSECVCPGGELARQLCMRLETNGNAVQPLGQGGVEEEQLL